MDKRHQMPTWKTRVWFALARVLPEKWLPPPPKAGGNPDDYPDMRR